MIGKDHDGVLATGGIAEADGLELAGEGFAGLIYAVFPPRKPQPAQA